MSGHNELVIGPMFSGKSTELIRRLRLHTIAKRKCLGIKYAGDDRYSKTHLATHDGIRFLARSADELCSLLPEARDFDVIGIDEGQFFHDLVPFCEELANSGKIVIVAALSGDFKRQPFVNVSELASKVEKISKLKAICGVCGKPAYFTMRTHPSEEREVIGGIEKYTAVCRSCYNQHSVHRAQLASST